MFSYPSWFLRIKNPSHGSNSPTLSAWFKSIVRWNSMRSKYQCGLSIRLDEHVVHKWWSAEDGWTASHVIHEQLLWYSNRHLYFRLILLLSFSALISLYLSLSLFVCTIWIAVYVWHWFYSATIWSLNQLKHSFVRLIHFGSQFFCCFVAVSLHNAYQCHFIHVFILQIYTAAEVPETSILCVVIFPFLFVFHFG